MESERFKNAVGSGNVDEVKQIIEVHKRELREHMEELRQEEKELEQTTMIVRCLKDMCALEQKRLHLEICALDVMLK